MTSTKTATPKHIMIIAGEASGDQHAARLVRQLQRIAPFPIQFSGMGGKHMAEVGVTLISDLAHYGVTGFSGIFFHFRKIHRAFRDIQAQLRENPPDLLILVDYPGFNLRLAKYAKHTLGLRILYYISPQIWAWKKNRIHTIKACVDHMAVILPFEISYYQAENIPVSFVGHPLLEDLPSPRPLSELRSTLGLPLDKKIVAFLPGSRTHEIQYHLPILLQSAQTLAEQDSNLHFVLPLAATVERKLVKSYLKKYTLPFTLVSENALLVMQASDAVVVASGTASLECALLEKPMCIIYKGGFFSYMIANKVIRVPYFGLCNLLSHRMIVPELLQYDVTAAHLCELIPKLLDPEQTITMRQDLYQLKQQLSSPSHSNLAELALGLMH
ncbi:MAG: lipid-A-disaccharide synthase [Legionellaceae bacterium]|nr:lipid-A-disaccharide synthase [Legionellaceae bacterium]